MAPSLSCLPWVGEWVTHGAWSGLSSESEGPAWGAHMRNCLAVSPEQQDKLWDNIKKGQEPPNVLGTSLWSSPQTRSLRYCLLPMWGQMWGLQGTNCTCCLQLSVWEQAKTPPPWVWMSELTKMSKILKKVCCNRNKLLMSYILHRETKANCDFQCHCLLLWDL